MTIDWQVLVEKRGGVAKSQSLYDVVSLEPSYARMKLRGEERRTANGELVAWELIAQSAQEYCWHRADRGAGACTRPVKGCGVTSTKSGAQSEDLQHLGGP